MSEIVDLSGQPFVPRTPKRRKPVSSEIVRLFKTYLRLAEAGHIQQAHIVAISPGNTVKFSWHEDGTKGQLAGAVGVALHDMYQRWEPADLPDPMAD